METISATTDETATLADRLEADRARLVELTGHRDRLTSQVAVATEAAALVQARAGEAEAGLTTGAYAVGDVLHLRAEVETCAQRVEALRLALGKVEAEHAQVADRIVAGERRLEFLRQQDESEPLRAEAAALVDAFAQAVVTLGAPLARRRELAVKLAATYPLATKIPGLDGDAVGRAVLRVHGKDAPLYAVVPWLARLLAAPGDRVADPALLRERFMLEIR